MRLIVLLFQKLEAKFGSLTAAPDVLAVSPFESLGVAVNIDPQAAAEFEPGFAMSGHVIEGSFSGLKFSGPVGAV